MYVPSGAFCFPVGCVVPEFAPTLWFTDQGVPWVPSNRNATTALFFFFRREAVMEASRPSKTKVTWDLAPRERQLDVVSVEMGTFMDFLASA